MKLLKETSTYVERCYHHLLSINMLTAQVPTIVRIALQTLESGKIADSLALTSSLAEGIFTKSPTSTHCPWKGDASYYNLETDSTSRSGPILSLFIANTYQFFPNVSLTTRRRRAEGCGLVLSKPQGGGHEYQRLHRLLYVCPTIYDEIFPLILPSDKNKVEVTSE
jgi:hypothetical protein